MPSKKVLNKTSETNGTKQREKNPQKQVKSKKQKTKLCKFFFFCIVADGKSLLFNIIFKKLLRKTR